jgi:YHS domain-containing protein
MNKLIRSINLLIVIIVIAFSSGIVVAQHNHGENKNKDTTLNNSQTKATDPVCKMEVTKNDSLSVNYNDHIYYFCSEKDLKIFLKSPQKYIVVNESEQNEEHNHGMMGMSSTMMIIMGSVMAVMMIAGMMFLKK